MCICARKNSDESIDPIGRNLNFKTYQPKTMTPKTRSPSSQASASYAAEATFLQVFCRSPACLSLICMTMLIAAGSGITGIATPGILTNQYAYQDFDLPLNETCTDNKFVDGSKLSKACESGSDRAQDVVSLFEIVMNLMVLVTSPMLGYWTDIYGRKTFLLAGIFLTCPIAFSLMIVENNPDITPLVYFFSYTLQGLIFTLPVLLSALSDSVPIQHRAPAFGILLAVLMATVSSMSVASAFLSDRTCCFLSVLFNAVGFVFAVFCVPETLTEATRLTSRLKADEKAQLPGSVPRLLQPFVDLKILNRNSLFRYLAILVIFSSMVAEGSQVLMLYYLQDNFDFKSTDSGNATFLLSKANKLTHF